MPRPALTLAASIAAVSVTALAGCSQSNGDYCCTTIEACNRPRGTGVITPCTDPARPFCDNEGEYPASGGVGRTCIPDPFADGGMPDADGDGGPADAGPDAAPACETSADCTGPTAPICSPAGACAACESGATGDADCAAKDAFTPRCAPSGACVACLDSGDCATPSEPVCDTETNTCRTCEAHSECASEVCNYTTGACIGTGDIIYVDRDTGADGPSCGTQGSPCAAIIGANGGLAKVGGSRRTVRVRASSDAYTGQVALNNLQVTIIGPGATIDPVSANIAALRVHSGSVATVEGLHITGGNGDANGDGVLCRDSGTSLRLFTVAIDGNSGQGVDVPDNCALTVERSTVSGNDGGGIRISDAAFTLRNNFITSNGVAGAVGSTFGGVQVNNGAGISPQILEFNTIADSKAQNAVPAAGVSCTTGTPMTASNNIVYLHTGAVALLAGSCSWSYSDVEGGQAGTGNIDMDPEFEDPLTGKFHLMSDSPCRNAADPAATLAVDFDGDVRPQEGRSDIGADEVPAP